MLLWPTVSVLGFLLLAVVVIALGVSSTARYEVERHRVQVSRQQVGVPATAGASPAGLRSAATSIAGDQSRPLNGTAVLERAASDRSAADEPGAAHGLPRQAVPGSVATLPEAGRLGDDALAPAWWLVTEEDHRVVAGPFPDRVEAEWAALAGAVGVPAHAVHGVRRTGDGLEQRQTPGDRAWLSELGDQLDRLPEDWDAGLADDDPTATLVVEVAAALVEAGLLLHDCAGSGTAGGVCLTPEPACAGVLVSWHQHDRMSRDQLRGAGPVTAVQQAMNAAVAECLEQLGFLVAPFGSSGCSVVIDARTWW